MNVKARNFVRNFSYTLTSNLISMVISALVVFIVPKLVGIEEYGFWQLYLFYGSYVTFLHFGWSDGIYLRYGGHDYENLNKKKIFSQFYMLLIFQIIIAVIILIITNIFILDINKLYIFQMLIIFMIIMNMRSILLCLLQATNRFKENSRIIIIDRLMYLLLIILFLIFGVRSYKLMIVVDLISKLVSLAFAIYFCRDILYQSFYIFQMDLKEAFYNINSGFKLMFSNTVSMLIIGVVRFGIENTWGISVFGKISLTLNISNFMMLFINAIGMIMFPILRRTDKEKYVSIYETFRTILMITLFGILIFYYPLTLILTLWLPEYSDSLIYMALVFPMFVYEGKMALLINTYLKTLREEKKMLMFNLISLFLSIFISIIVTIVLKNLDLAILSIVILLAFRSILAEILLSRLINITIYKDIILELMMTILFILTGWYINNWLTFIIYTIVYITYLLIKKRDIIKAIKNIKKILITP